MNCESCKINQVQIEEFVNALNKPYKLCYLCHQRLIDYALRPLEFFNLAAIHGYGYYLHDDFYEFETGYATQPKSEVRDIQQFPLPELKNIKNDLKSLIDYACVQYEISKNVIELIRIHNNAAILNYLENKTQYNRAINYKTYEIAANVLGSTAKEWIKIEWENRRENEILIFAEAICKCLPFNEAFQLLTKEIEASSEKYFTEGSSALLYFQNSIVLDWIELISPRIKNVSTSWGVLAAASQFSWIRAEKWLKSGRPLSLIALDALTFCTMKATSSNQAFWLIKHPPKLIEQPTTVDMVKALTSYLEIDRVPRTNSAVKKILQNIM